MIKNFLKKFVKTLDKQKQIVYNINVKRMEAVRYENDTQSNQRQQGRNA